MPLSYKEITSNGQSTQDLSFDFDYIEQDHISVYVDGVQKTFSTQWDFTDSNTVHFQSGLHPASGAIIRIERTTPSTTRIVDFQDGSVLSEKDLDDSARQLFFISQEAADTAGEGITRSATGDFSAQIDGTNRRITNVADPVDAQDVATKNYIQTQTASDLAAVTAARDLAEDYRDEANTAKTEAEGFKNSAETARDNAETFKDNAETARDNAQTYASTAQGYLQAASLPQTLTGQADKFLQVRDDETAYELVTSVASPQFYGFKQLADGTIQHDHGKLDVNVEDYDDYYMGENIEFEITNNNLVMTY